MDYANGVPRIWGTRTEMTCNMRLIAFLLGCQLTAALAPAQQPPAAADTAALTHFPTSRVTVAPGPDDANIARVTARILERSHYLKQPFDKEVSSRFLDRYLNTLDNLHIYFLQSDLAEFEKYRHTLDELTLKEGDTSPARVIFLRFLERLRQQYEYATNLLQTTKFDFNTDERFLLNRKTQPRPENMAAAKQLWRERLRYEYLQEKLGIGRPEEIAGIVREKLDQQKPKEIAKALQEKLSKEKAQEIAKLVAQKSGGESADAIVQSIRAKLDKDNAEEIVKILTRRYSRLLRALNEYDNDDVLQVYLTALTHVYDPHSDYMGHSEMENFAISMKLSLFGIGALLQSEDGYCKIRSLTPNGPAERGKKLKPNDKIIAVAQSNQPPVDVVDVKLNKVVELIRGPKNTEVRLTIIPADAPDPSVRKVVTLVRDEIKLEDQEAKAKLIELPDAKGQCIRLGVIDLPSFYSDFDLGNRKPNAVPKSTTVDVARLIKKLVEEKVAGIVLDLRRNGGGALDEAIRLTGLFIKEGPVVQVKGPEGPPIIEKDPDPAVFYDGPLVVLTSRFSASASEILAGALQDYGRALVVGDSSTHGKGTVQSLLQLAPFMRGQMALVSSNDPGAMKITIRKFYRASGASTQLKGVVPDLILPSIYNHAEVGESSLDDPLPWDTIAPAEYEKQNRVEPVLAEVRKRSEARVASDRDFAFLRDEIERYKKMVAEKSVSLNEAQRVKEKQEADERAKARKKELAARPEPPGKMYDITLKVVDLPGLPPPVAKTNAVKTVDAGKPGQAQPGAPGYFRKMSGPETQPAVGSDKTVTAQVTEKKDTPASDLKDDEDETAADDKAPNLDIILDEAKRILVDFISLSQSTKSLAGTAGGK